VSLAKAATKKYRLAKRGILSAAWPSDRLSAYISSK
jgi:hypothetical protein